MKQAHGRMELEHLKRIVKKIFPISLTFCLLWFLANYFYNYGLLYASITSSVVLSNTSSAWVFLLSISCLVPSRVREKFDIISALMIAVSLAGFVLIAVEDRHDAEESGDSGTERPVLGDVLSLFSAMSYALYATYLKIKVPEEEEATFKFSYFLGFVGISNDILLLGLFFIFDATGFETFEWPPRETLILLSVNAFFGTFVSDYCWARSVLLLGPFVTTLGITLTFPISAIFDSLVNDAKFSYLYLLGSILIFTAFGVIITKDFMRRRAEERKKKEEE